jgi:hypothetical protein
MNQKILSAAGGEGDNALFGQKGLATFTTRKWLDQKNLPPHASGLVGFHSPRTTVLALALSLATAA